MSHPREQVSDIEQMNQIALDQIRSFQINVSNQEDESQPDDAQPEDSAEQYRDLVQRLDIVQQLLQSSGQSIPQQSDARIDDERI